MILRTEFQIQLEVYGIIQPIQMEQIFQVQVNITSKKKSWVMFKKQVDVFINRWVDDLIGMKVHESFVFFSFTVDMNVFKAGPSEEIKSNLSSSSDSDGSDNNSSSSDSDSSSTSDGKDSKTQTKAPQFSVTRYFFNHSFNESINLTIFFLF